VETRFICWCTGIVALDNEGLLDIFVVTGRAADRWYTLISVDQLDQEVYLANKAAVMVNRLPITKARINLGQIARRAHLNKEYFILEKDGIPVIGIMDADELEDYLESRDARVRRFIRQSHREYLAGKSRSASELLAELRQEKAKPGSRRRR